MDEEDVEEKEEENEVWFDKVKFLIDHIRSVSMNLIWVLRTFMSIDEMMIRFMGRSTQTHRVKNKPISEGYKFFALCTYLGFVIFFTPDGRTAAFTKNQEYEEGPDGKIMSMIQHITDIVDKKEKKNKTDPFVECFEV